MNRPNAQIDVAESCVPNIGQRGRERRMRNGVIWLFVAFAVTAWAETGGRTDWWIWFVLAAAYFLAMIGVFQSREKT